VRAYRTASRAVAGFAGDLKAALASGELAAVKGIGPATLELVGELLRTGKSTLLEGLRDDLPMALAEMLKISGLGVTKIRQIWDSLHIESLEELEEAARDGRLEKLPRFGKKTAENILKGIAFLRQVSEFRLYHHARAEANALADVLSTMPEVSRAMVVGSVRRRREGDSRSRFRRRGARFSHRTVRPAAIGCRGHRVRRQDGRLGGSFDSPRAPWPRCTRPRRRSSGSSSCGPPAAPVT